LAVATAVLTDAMPVELDRELMPLPDSSDEITAETIPDTIEELIEKIDQAKAAAKRKRDTRPGETRYDAASLGEEEILNDLEQLRTDIQTKAAAYTLKENDVTATHELLKEASKMIAGNAHNAMAIRTVIATIYDAIIPRMNVESALETLEILAGFIEDTAGESDTDGLYSVIAPDAAMLGAKFSRPEDLDDKMRRTVENALYEAIVGIGVQYAVDNYYPGRHSSMTRSRDNLAHALLLPGIPAFGVYAAMSYIHPGNPNLGGR